jgi:hypothetical protein
MSVRILMKKYKHIFLFVALVFLCFSFSACQKKEETAVPSIEGYPTIHETEFGGVYIKIPIDEFNKLGFEFGDSVDVEFSSGYKLEDIPYYNGYYVDPGQILLIGYPGYDYIKAAINYGEDLWDEAKLQISMGNSPTLFQQVKLDEHSTASIRLREKGKYRDIQEARDISYTDLRKDYPSDVAFANFRNIVMGQIGKGKVYRSASPCDNQHKRAPYVDVLIKEAAVNYILDLADNDVKIEKYLQAEDFASEYFRTLYEEGRVYPLALSMNYMGEDFAIKVADGFIAMSKAEGPYLIHCTEGKDRTGFVCMMLEALAKADYQQIADDYMLTYDNYYKINEVKDPARYRVILEKNLDAMIRYVVGDESVDFRNCDLSIYARAYLLKAGMEEEQIDTLLEKIR